MTKVKKNKVEYGKTPIYFPVLSHIERENIVIIDNPALNRDRMIIHCLIAISVILSVINLINPVNFKLCTDNGFMIK